MTSGSRLSTHLHIVASLPFCYALGMNLQAQLAYAPASKAAIEQIRRERGWMLWLAPRPFAVVATLVYLSTTFLMGLGCLTCISSWQDALVIGVFAALIVLDRLDFWLFGETPPLRAGIALLAVRVLLLETLAQVHGHQIAMFAYALLPYIASLYFGTRGAYFMGAFAWLAVVARMTADLLPKLAYARDTYYFGYNMQNLWGEYFSGVAGYSMALVFVVIVARIVIEEKAGRARADELLAELEHSHWQLKAYSERALAATQERNRLAQAIHDNLGQYLSAISVQLEKARTFRPIDPPQADQAVEDAKELASEALNDVRRSVGALRTPKGIDVQSDITSPPSHDGLVSRGRTRSRVAVWLAPRPFDVISTAVYLGVLLMDLGWPESGEALFTGRNVMFAAAVLGLLVLDRLDYFMFGEVPPRAAAAVFLALRVLLLAIIVAVAGAWYLLWFVPIITYVVFNYFGSRAGYLAGAAAWLVIGGLFILGPLLQGSPVRFDLGEIASAAALITLMMAMGVMTARTVLKERASRLHSEQLRSDLEEADRQLRGFSEQAIAAGQERNHMAREIHDGLGHYLTVINVQLEKAIAFRERDPEAADRALHESSRLTTEALQDVRRTMGTLRDSRETISFRPALESLVENTRHSVPVELHVEGQEDGYSRQALMVLYRAAQEGLTNIQKHSKAGRAVVSLTFGEGHAALDLVDYGQGFDPTLLQADGLKSYGLEGVRERLELAGGSLEIESKPGEGTRLHITVPKDPLARTLATATAHSTKGL